MATDANKLDLSASRSAKRPHECAAQAIAGLLACHQKDAQRP
jgi:hypothetical protein